MKKSIECLSTLSKFWKKVSSAWVLWVHCTCEYQVFEYLYSSTYYFEYFLRTFLIFASFFEILLYSFSCSASFLLNPCLLRVFWPLVLSSVKNVYFNRSWGTVLLSFAITLSRSNRKNGALGISYFARRGLFLSFICSRFNIACHFVNGYSLRLKYFCFSSLWVFTLSYNSTNFCCTCFNSFSTILVFF